jgi:hypothetical protein
MYKFYYTKKIKASILPILVFVFYIMPFVLSAQCDAFDPMVPYICSGSGSTNCDAYPKNALLLETSPNETFTFDDITDYNSGETMTGSTILHLKVDSGNAALCKWKLVMMVNNGGAPTTNGTWEQLSSYGVSTLPKPPISLLQVRVYNNCNTPTCETWQNFTLNGQALYIIKAEPGPPITGCVSNVDGIGDYLHDYNAYTFTIDYRIVPGFNMPPGTYQLSLQFCLVEDD